MIFQEPLPSRGEEYMPLDGKELKWIQLLQNTNILFLPFDKLSSSSLFCIKVYFCLPNRIAFACEFMKISILLRFLLLVRSLTTKVPMPLILIFVPSFNPCASRSLKRPRYRVVRTLRMTLCLYSDNILSTCMPLPIL